MTYDGVRRPSIVTVEDLDRLRLSADERSEKPAAPISECVWSFKQLQPVDVVAEIVTEVSRRAPFAEAQ